MVKIEKTQLQNTSILSTPQSNKSKLKPIFNLDSDDKQLGLEVESQTNKTKLTDDELKNAPSSDITINGKKQKATIVVDLSENKLYRYNEDGTILDGYHIASGKLKKDGKSLTSTGIRKVDHIEDYPYSKARGSKRSRNPKAYGPNILYLTIVDAKTGETKGSNGEFIHGNNNEASIGTAASHGCIRMDNEVIKQFAKEVPTGSYVLIQE